MIKPEQIPVESLKAYKRAFKNGGGPADGIAAALNAWEGAVHSNVTTDPQVMPPRILILPLPKEGVDGK